MNLFCYLEECFLVVENELKGKCKLTVLVILLANDVPSVSFSCSTGAATCELDQLQKATDFFMCVRHHGVFCLFVY